jgi:hypothetical protein
MSLSNDRDGSKNQVVRDEKTRGKGQQPPPGVSPGWPQKAAEGKAVEMKRESQSHCSWHSVCAQSRRLREDSRELRRRSQAIQRRLHTVLAKQTKPCHGLPRVSAHRLDRGDERA